MNRGSLEHSRLRIKKSDYTCLLFFLFLCVPFFRAIFSTVFSAIGVEDGARTFILIVIAVLFLILCLQERKLLIPDFWLLLFAVAVFFALSYLAHPESAYWFERDGTGAFDYVFRPNNGLYIYLFIRLINDPKRILKTVKLAGWPMYLHFLRLVMQAMARGYWIDTSIRGYAIHKSYNLTLGYDVLIFALAFLYCALEEKRAADWIGALIGIGIILAAGSRGPVLDIGIFAVLYVLIKVSASRKKTAVILGLVILGAGFVIAYPYLLLMLSRIMERFHISSRFLTMLSNGAITEDSGRLTIWNATWEMIKENPLGYGAFGSRPVISQYIFVAHPHQLFLEVLVDFGVFFGGAFIIWLLYSTVKIFRMRGIPEWKGVFLIFFARACQLLVSLTFWHSIGLWGALAVGVCIYSARRKGLTSYGGQ